MKKAIELAKKAQYLTDPNPIVGAVLVDREGEILSEGYHAKAGLAHAEVVALQSWETVPEDSTLYVTLEPCCIHGKTPPCVDLVLRKKVRKIVIGCLDPNPEVAGRSVDIMKSAGVNVTTGILEKECLGMNEIFNKHIVTKIPFVAVKSAFTIDGQISMPDGSSRWITGEKAREAGHQLRSRYNAILVGKNTLLTDNPQLTDRISKSPRQPVRVVLASSLDVPDDYYFIKDIQTRKLLFSGNRLTEESKKKLEAAGVEVFIGEGSQPEIEWVLKVLYQEGIYSVLIEGGGEIISSFLRAGEVDKMHLFISGKLIGGNSGTPWCGDLGFAKLKDVPHMQFDRVSTIGEDLMIEAHIKTDVDQ